MLRIVKTVENQVTEHLRTDRAIRQERLQEMVRKNNISMLLICAIIFVVEFYNIWRVLFWSASGLSTRNNRIYFTMYCTLIGLAVLWLVLRRVLRQAPVRRQWVAQCVVTSLLFLWHLGLNTYDLYRDPAGGITVLTTALLGLAFLIQSPPWYSVVQLGVDYLLFRIVMVPWLEAGDRINLTIVFTVALAVSVANAYHTTVMLTQQKQILQMNAQLHALVERDPLTGLLNKITVECRTEQLLLNPEQMERTGGLTLILLDLDEFKWINDHYGHPCGDHVLTQMAEAMRKAFPEAVCLGRIGGDEFAAVYARPLTEPGAVALGEQLAVHLKEIRWQDQPMEVRCSMGACVCTLPGRTYRQLYEQTDQMLYQAKKAGKGRCLVRRMDHAVQSQLATV